jgi:hypothetical protein
MTVPMDALLLIPPASRWGAGCVQPKEQAAWEGKSCHPIPPSLLRIRVHEEAS